jgi:hypothetical protein
MKFSDWESDIDKELYDRPLLDVVVNDGSDEDDITLFGKHRKL